MNRKIKAFAVVGSVVLAIGCGGGDKTADSPDDGPVENAGESVDDTAENVEDGAEEATEEVGEGAEKAGDEVGEATKDEE